MNAGRASLLALLLMNWAGCADFAREEQAFCERNAERCGPCGNGIVEPGEACDDGNEDSNDGCSGDCRSTEICGNGYLDPGKGEACDDGNTVTETECPYGTPSCEFCSAECTHSLRSRAATAATGSSTMPARHVMMATPAMRMIVPLPASPAAVEIAT